MPLFLEISVRRPYRESNPYPFRKSAFMTTTSPLLEELTDKHVEVLELLEKRRTSKEIAKELDISPATVEQRIRRCRELLGGSNRRELVDLWDKVKKGLPETLYESDDLPSSAFPDVEAVNETGPVVNGDQEPEAHTGDQVPIEADPPGFVARFSGKRRSPMLTIGVVVGLSIAIMMLLLVGLVVAREFETLLS